MWSKYWLFTSGLTMNSYLLFVWTSRPNNSSRWFNIGLLMALVLRIRMGPPAGYVRHGVGEIYMAFEPLAGLRFVTVKDDHKAIIWVGVIVNLLDGPYANCMKMTVVGDNLSAHKPSAFYRVFEAEKAKAYLDRLDFVYTPKHGS